MYMLHETWGTRKKAKRLFLSQMSKAADGYFGGRQTWSHVAIIILVRALLETTLTPVSILSIQCTTCGYTKWSIWFETQQVFFFFYKEPAFLWNITIHHSYLVFIHCVLVPCNVRTCCTNLKLYKHKRQMQFYQKMKTSARNLLQTHCVKVVTSVKRKVEKN